MNNTITLPEGYRLKVVHLHENNSSKEDRMNSKYVTLAAIFDDNNNSVGTGIARCSKHDEPNRKMGFNIAVQRAAKQAGLIL